MSRHVLQSIVYTLIRLSWQLSEAGLGWRLDPRPITAMLAGRVPIKYHYESNEHCNDYKMGCEGYKVPYTHIHLVTWALQARVSASLDPRPVTPMVQGDVSIKYHFSSSSSSKPAIYVKMLAMQKLAMRWPCGRGVARLHAARPDSVLKGSSGHALLCGQQWLVEGSPLHSTRDDSLAHRQAQAQRCAQNSEPELLFARN